MGTDRVGFRAGAPVPPAGPSSTEPLRLSPEALLRVAVKKGTCPFIGSAIVQGDLPVFESAQAPLGRLDDVVKLGDTGTGSNLGSEVLRLFALGNHSQRIVGTPPGRTPLGFWSMDFPGSQGAHFGGSNILREDPTQVGSGWFSQSDFERLLSHQRDGCLTREEVGKFIAENLRLDPHAKVSGQRVAGLLARDVVALARTSVSGLAQVFTGKLDGPEAERERAIALTKLTGEDNLVGSSGEWGLLFAFLQNSPRTRHTDEGPELSVEDVRSMFVDKQLPDGWQGWTKTRNDWLKDSSALALHAAEAYRRAR